MKYAYNCQPDFSLCRVACIGERGLVRRHGRLFHRTQALDYPQGVITAFKQLFGVKMVYTPFIVYSPAHNVYEVSEEIASAAYSNVTTCELTECE